jgi:hypothetical protein
LWNVKCVRELQGRFDSARGRYEVMSAGWHEERAEMVSQCSTRGELEVEGGLKSKTEMECAALTAKATDCEAGLEEGGVGTEAGEKEEEALTMGVGSRCRDEEDRELHPQWTCSLCLRRLDDYFYRLVVEGEGVVGDEIG